MIVAISFQFEFQKKRKYRIILFDLSIVSLDIAKIGRVSENNLTFVFFKSNVALSNLKLKGFLGVFLNSPLNL